jgi:hypothetical protein
VSKLDIKVPLLLLSENKVMKAFNAWKAQPANKGKTDQAFRLTDDFKGLPPAPPKAAKSSIPTFDYLQHRQNEIRIPIHFELSY